MQCKLLAAIGNFASEMIFKISKSVGCVIVAHRNA